MKTYDYKYSIGQKVRIHGSETASAGCKENAGRVVTIKNLCEFTLAYELEELDNFWAESCFELV